MNYQIVINSKSGDGIFCDETQQDRLRQIFTERGHQVDLSVVEPDQLEATLKEKAESAGEVLIVGGGDGTITTAARLLHGTGKTLGVLPLGTFNLEARDLKLPLDPFEAAGKLIDAETILIDLLKVNEDYCMCDTEKMTKIESSKITITVRRRHSIPVMIDGEILRISLPCRLEILPRALNVLRPRNESS